MLQEPPSPVLIPGTSIRLRVRGGDVATVLLEVARRFNEEVEPLALPVKEKPGYDDWGWAYRPVRGQEFGFSNHASGTAIDLNATRHPRGVGGTFSRRQEAAMRRILAATFDAAAGRNVVRWGRDYLAAPEDAMHLEINASHAAVSRVAARIRAKRADPVTPKPAPSPITEEDDDMKSDEELPLGQWGIDVMRDTDGKITAGQALVIQTVAAAQTNELVHAMAAALAEMQKTLAAMLAELRKRSG